MELPPTKNALPGLLSTTGAVPGVQALHTNLFVLAFRVAPHLFASSPKKNLVSYPRRYLHKRVPPGPSKKTQPPRPTGSVPRAAGLNSASLFSSGKARRKRGGSNRRVPTARPPEDSSRQDRVCREMPPVRLNLRDLPRLPDGVAGNDNNAGVERSSAAVVGAGMATGDVAAPFGDAWPTWPLVALSTVHSTVKGWFTRLDAALMGLPRGLGPAVSSLVSVGEASRCTTTVQQ